MTIVELKLKAGLKQLAYECCPGHIYDKDYHWSTIDYCNSSSVACSLCGSRVTIAEANKHINEKH